jgi:predicted ABC-type ATPase
MIAGPNGSGKSTLTDFLRAAGVDFGHYINADDIDRTLDGPPGVERSTRAQAMAEQARRDCMARRENFSFETVMSHPSKVRLLADARALG